MKSSIRGLLMGVLGAAALSLSPLAVSPARADMIAGEITLGQERVQVIHTGDDSDATNLNFSFTNSGNGYGGCDYGEDDAIASGVEVALLGKSCGAYFYECYYYDYCPPTSSFPFDYVIDPFVAHTINTQSYGTFFGQYPVDEGPGTVSARIVSTPETVRRLRYLDPESRGDRAGPVQDSKQSCLAVVERCGRLGSILLRHL